MQTNSNDNIQEDDDAKVSNEKNEIQSWRIGNGLVFSKRDKDKTDRREGFRTSELKLNTLNSEKHMGGYNTTDTEIFDSDTTMRSSGNRILRSANQNNRDITGVQKTARVTTQISINDKNKVTPLTHLFLNSEDMRISKILRRLLMEKNPTTAIDLCKKLEIAVRNPSNASYICRSFDLLLENIIAILKQGPTECLKQVSSILGLLGYINRSNFSTYRNYLTKAYQSSHGLEKYMMTALKTTLRCDAVNRDLCVYCDNLLILLKNFLENAVVAENFIAVSETIAEFSKNYKREFAQHFTDIVDIIVGWHLEVEQPQNLKKHCSKILQQFSLYFIKELDFTLGLLGQFLEDIMAFGENIDSEDDADKHKAVVSFGAFVGAFTTILKALGTRDEFISVTPALNGIVKNALMVVVNTANQIMSTRLSMSEETILNINDFLCLIFLNNCESSNLHDIEELLRLQIEQLAQFNELQVNSLLYLIYCIVHKLRTHLPLSIVTVIFSSELPSPLNMVRLKNNTRLYKLLLRIYHEVLIIKNVPLLQEAYKHIKGHVEIVVNTLSERKCTLPISECVTAEATLNFYLAAISALATQTSSIIGMYALNPSILELLISNCKAASMELWLQYPTLHGALLQVLVVHCQKNHNFIPTSRLLSDHHDTSSPTSENFSMILKFLAEILQQYKQLCDVNLEILLKWITSVMDEFKEQSEYLTQHADFLIICKCVAMTALQTPLASANCIEVLLRYDSLPEDVLQSFRDVVVMLLDAHDTEVKLIYTIIYAKLPIHVTLTQSRERLTALIERQRKRCALQHWYKSTSNFAYFRSKYFKPYLESMDSNCDARHISLKFFNKCWPTQIHADGAEYQQMVTKSAKMLDMWLQFETARYCVLNKLRTSIGKPQETFLTIEAMIMKYARRLMAKENTNDDTTMDDDTQTLDKLIVTQGNTRLLLTFVLELEKLIYNAAEGTAFAILPPEKPARSFFRINAHTCHEWFKRISAGINLIGLHSMEYELVIHFCESILKTEKFQDSRLERTVTSLVWALLACDEANTLKGLYAWLKAKTGKRYTWIQYAAEQAAGRREVAADGYSAVLNENDAKMDNYTRDFLTDQLLECLYSTAQWHKMREVMQTYKSNQSETSKLYNAYSDTHIDTIEALCFGHSSNASTTLGANKALLKLSEWQLDDNKVDVKLDQVTNNYSYYNISRKLEDACIANALKKDGTPLAPDILHSVQQCLQESLRHGCMLKRSLHQSNFIILNNVAQRLSVEGDVETTLDCSQSVEQSSVRLKCLLWTLLLKQRSYGAGSNDYHRLYLDVADSARLEGNSNLCRSMLMRFLVLKGFTDSPLTIAESFAKGSYIIDLQDGDLMRGFNEITKCMFGSPHNHQLDAINLGAAFCCQIIEQLKTSSDPKYPAMSANILLTLAEWLTQRGTGTSSAAAGGGNNGLSSAFGSVHLQRLLENLPNLPTDVNEDNSNVIPNAEKAVGKLLFGSLCQQAESGEAWLAYGNWCYRWGKKLVEARNNDSSSSKNTISARDMSAIKEILGEETSEIALKELVNVLQSHPLNTSDGIEELDGNEISSCTTELLASELSKLDIMVHRSKETISDIIDIWRQAHKNVYAYYELATRAYFKYLAIETLHAETKGAAHAMEDSTFVTTTLRILRLIVKHAIGLQEVLQEGLSTTPLRPWKVIIPQLFSRLNHHEPYVRKSVSDLLCRLADNRPHLIIFPAVVGAQQELKSHASSEESSSTPTDKEASTASLCNSFSSLLNTLSKQAPEAVLHVQLLVRELKRITLLWEEYWVHSLAQLYSDYAPLFNALEMEAKKGGDMTKLQPHYSILMSHVVSDLERIAAVSHKSAETNYERNFQERYNNYIANTIMELQKDPVDWHKPTEGWQRIKQLYSVFQQRALRGGATATMKIHDLSPVLANMRNTTISMPGVDSNEMQTICIRSVESTVYVLPTKTKPKKLAFIGSNGRKYTYLFKGLEDLHLDERIMQFLSISNSMMARSNDAQCTTDCYKAHHYSVIPLGPQSGLISWVDGVTPLFALYKKWQQRDVALKQQQKDRTTLLNANQNGVTEQSASPPPATRPSEMYYNKLTPLLAEQNIRITDPRKQWPLATLRRVLEELTKETPRDLLSKELWCNAVSATQWRKSVRSYAISMAVMSVIGYVIGLGDRHLDNVLIKLSTGEILHIDYNVCFEKGKTLRVPEKVPFRMTPNLEEALGITGVEGNFRLGCEQVLKILRKERETLLTLLEAFVYDPLVDWTVNDESSTTTNTTRTTSAHVATQRINALKLPLTYVNVDNGRVTGSQDLVQKKMDWEATRQNIILKFNEIKPIWTKYKDDIHEKLLKFNNSVEHLFRQSHAIKQAEEERDNLTKQLAMIHEVEALGTARGSHALNTITQRYAAYKNATTAFNVVKQNVETYHGDIKHLLEIYYESLIEAPPDGNELNRLEIDLCEQQQHICINEFETVQAFLQQTVEDQELYSQSDFARKNMENIIQQVTHAALKGLELLLLYANVMQYYPRSLLQRNHLLRYEQWCRQLRDEQCDPVVLRQDVERWLQIDAQIQEAELARAQQMFTVMERISMRLDCDQHKAQVKLTEQETKTHVSVDIAVNAIRTFVTIDPDLHHQALHFSLWNILSQANESFSQFEETALHNRDPHLLSQQINYIDVLQNMCASIFTIPLPYESLTALQTMKSALLCLQNLNFAFEVPIVERIMHLYMLDTNVDVQATLNVMCTSPTSVHALLHTPDNIRNRSLRSLLIDVFGLFGEFEQQLRELQQLVQNSENENFSQYLELKIRNSGLNALVETTKFETIAQIFRYARDAVIALKENTSENVYDVCLLSAPVTDYIHHMQKYQLSGLTTYFAALLQYNLHADYYSVAVAGIDNMILANAQELIENLSSALHYNVTLKDCQSQMQRDRKSAKHYMFVASAHFWANEMHLQHHKQFRYVHIADKEVLLSSLQNVKQTLMTCKNSLTTTQLEIEQFTETITERLSVASSQQSVQMSFVEHADAQQTRYMFHRQLVTKLIEYIDVLVQFELARAGKGGYESDNVFLGILAQWQESCGNLRHSSMAITPVEQAIVQLLDPEGKVDQCWIDNISGLLDDMTYGLHRKLDLLECEAQTQQENLFVDAQYLQPLIDSQTRLDVRHLLKMIGKSDRNTSNGNSEASRVRELQHGLKYFYGKLNELQLQLLLRDYTESALCKIKERISELIASNEQNNQDLQQLLQRIVQSETVGGSGATASDNKSNNAALMGPITAGDKKVAANQSEQKRNAYAVSVWKRIRMKLEGRDPDPNCRSSISDQVDYMIREAINPDNLAVLYEGWTPWV